MANLFDSLAILQMISMKQRLSIDDDAIIREQYSELNRKWLRSKFRIENSQQSSWNTSEKGKPFRISNDARLLFCQHILVRFDHKKLWLLMTSLLCDAFSFRINLRLLLIGLWHEISSSIEALFFFPKAIYSKFLWYQFFLDALMFHSVWGINFITPRLIHSWKRRRRIFVYLGKFLNGRIILYQPRS